MSSNFPHKLKKGSLEPFLARPVGLEPTPIVLETIIPVLKTGVLPLHQGRINDCGDNPALLTFSLVCVYKVANLDYNHLARRNLIYQFNTFHAH